MNAYDRIKSKWMKHAPDKWWGDHIDVRFHLVSEFGKLKGKRILDVGCGAGILLSEIGDSNVKIGIDISKESLKIAKRLDSNADFIIGDMCRLPIKANVIEAISAANVIPGADYKVEDNERSVLQEKFVKELHRILKKDGVLFLTTPNRAWYRSPAKMSYEELEGLLEPYFDIEILGYNPFPRFPYFLPTRILARVPLIEAMLEIFMTISFLKKRSKYFHVRTVKT